MSPVIMVLLFVGGLLVIYVLCGLIRIAQKALRRNPKEEQKDKEGSSR